MARPRGFSFGRNWRRYVESMPDDAVESMSTYVAGWLGNDLRGLRLLDIGSGQGLTSLAAHRLGADVTSFDVDPDSVAATRLLWEREGSAGDWRILDGSVLDEEFMESLGRFDVVVSWGVLHHTGAMWRAIDAAAMRVASGGRLWLALYHKTSRSPTSLKVKRIYARLPDPGQRLMRGAYAAAKLCKSLVLRRRLPTMSGSYDNRGMTWWRDIEDWLGGLPYEVAAPGELVARLVPKGFALRRLDDAPGEGGNDVYLFRQSLAEADPSSHS